MVYSNNFVVAVKVNGQSQTELKDGSVILPFESEYVIHLRNKNRTRNAVAYVTIDGELVTPEGVVVYKNDYVDLERSTDKAVKFKFISLESSEAIDFGKDRENKDKGMGVIEVKWHYEKEKPAYVPPTIIHEHHYHDYNDYKWRRRPIFDDTFIRYATSCESRNATANMLTAKSLGVNTASFAASASNDLKGMSVDSVEEMSFRGDTQAFVNNALASNEPVQSGCTVEGGRSNQRFRTVHMDIEDDYTTIRLVLKGVKEYAVREASKRESGRIVHGDDRSRPILRPDVQFETESVEAEDPRVKQAREELAEMELQLIKAKMAKVAAELAALQNDEAKSTGLIAD